VYHYAEDVSTKQQNPIIKNVKLENVLSSPDKGKHRALIYVQYMEEWKGGALEKETAVYQRENTDRLLISVYSHICALWVRKMRSKFQGTMNARDGVILSEISHKPTQQILFEYPENYLARHKQRRGY